MTSALLSLAAAACGDDAPPAGQLGVLAPPAAGLGVQIRMASTLPPALETERCMFYQVPADGLFVNREEIRYSPGSHHVLLYTTPYTTIPATNRKGEPVDTAGGKVFDCGDEGATGAWEVNGVAGGAQSPDAPSGVDGLPPDTAFRLPGGSILLMNTHYINASADRSLETVAAINLYTIPAQQVRQEAGVLFFYNPFIRVPAMGDATAREVCPVRKDINLVNAQSHMHRRGVGYGATLLNAGLAPVTQLYAANNWERVVARRLDPSMAIPAGSFVDFHCDYHNTENRVVTQGRTTRDEMCIFIGLYYPRDVQTELCGLNAEWSGAFMSAVWVGSGAADGQTTAACLQGARPAREDGGASFYGCVVDSCAGIATPMSDAARCLATGGLGMCDGACGGAQADCDSCVRAQCGPALQALAGTACP